MAGETFAELFEKNLASFDVQPGSIIQATVTDIDDNFVTVDAGLKAESTIPKEQFISGDNELKVNIGDSVDVAVDMLEDGFGNPILSHEKARKLADWAMLENAEETGESITGFIVGRVKGGFTVTIGSITAFLPGSLADVRPVRDPGYLEGKESEFKVIKVDRRRNNIVVSRRAVIEEEYSAERETLLANLEEGQVVKGIVKSITDYGAFIDLGGVDGLLHITDMSWKRVKHPTELINVGDEIDVMVIKFDREKMRVSLGLKQLGEDPWKDISQRYPSGTRLFGKVTNITDYGCFVEIENGVEGLVHVSEMDWTNKNANPNKIVQPGQEVEVMVLEIDEERRRISLGMKQCVPNPWEAFAENHQKGDKVKGTIRSITDFGLFIGLEGGIDGLVHMTDISWTLPSEEALRAYKKGDEVEAVILSIDADRERIALGIKQLEEDHFSQYVSEHGKGDTVKGKVKSIEDKRAVIELADEVVGYLPNTEITEEKVEDISQHLEEGQEIEARITQVDKKERHIFLSLKAQKKGVDKDKAKKAKKRATESPASVKLGDLLKDQMEELKSEE